MKIRISHGAGHEPGREDWFVVRPFAGCTQRSASGTGITHEQAVMSLLAAGRAVYELELPAPGADLHAPQYGIWHRVRLLP